MMKIKTPKGTLYIGKEDVSIEDINNITNSIESVSVVTLANTVGIAVTGLIGLTAIGAVLVSSLKTRKLEKRVSELENGNKEEEV